MPRINYSDPEWWLKRGRLLPPEFKYSGIDFNKPQTTYFAMQEIPVPYTFRKRSVMGDRLTCFPKFIPQRKKQETSKLYRGGFSHIKELIEIHNELLSELSKYESYIKKDIECEKELEEAKIIFSKQNGSLLNRLFKKELLQKLKQKLILIQAVLIDNKRKLDETEKKLYHFYGRYNSKYNKIDEFLDDELFVTEKELNQICIQLNIKINYTNEKNFDREYAMKEAIKNALLIGDVHLKKFESINQKVLTKK